MSTLFPLIRHFSNPVSKVLIKLPVTPNQITSASLVFGLAGCFYLSRDSFEDRIFGCLFFIAAYILDNCDGEVARHKNLSTNFGRKLDSFVDWIVHTVFFAALGYGIAQETQDNIWLWLGLLGGLGGTINYSLGILLDDPNASQVFADASQPETLKDYIVFVFRELFRADFCFIVLALTLLDALWLLLPAAAIGAQIYWILYLTSRDKNYHV
jgi:phosphatidylglycerophosphate synthase